MLNKKYKKYNYNNGNTPTTINKYNKFLTTIDNTSKTNNIQEQTNETINSIIEKIEVKFENSNLNSITGYTTKDTFITNLKINNPDIYLDNTSLVLPFQPNYPITLQSYYVHC